MLGRLVLAPVVWGKWVGQLISSRLTTTDSLHRSINHSHIPAAEHEGALGEDVEEALALAAFLRACEVAGSRVLSVPVSRGCGGAVCLCVCTCVSPDPI